MSPLRSRRSKSAQFALASFADFPHGRPARRKIVSMTVLDGDWILLATIDDAAAELCRHLLRRCMAVYSRSALRRRLACAPGTVPIPLPRRVPRSWAVYPCMAPCATGSLTDPRGPTDGITKACLLLLYVFVALASLGVRLCVHEVVICER